ncbi:hypothetical protein LPJ66_004835 [Kickxella alabastrina]|uniref:Uncharacterized protein n=1 Tax=Kickxella alabastrina TaxID=61397 RepID=A0ACC1IM51_9FUNG|nr:hypothetical protein LPJ66_004835 [Kickxella alabastrina]
MQTHAIIDCVFCGISLVCSVIQCILIIYLVRRNGWVYSMFLQLNLAMAIVVTANRTISYLDIFFTALPPHVQQNQAFVRIMYGFLDISFLPFTYFFLIAAFSVDMMLNFALNYRSARRLHPWYIPMSLFLAFAISMPILVWPGSLGQNHLYIVDGNWAQSHYHIVTLSTVIIICTLASVALVGAGFWHTIREWHSLRREINGIVLPISDSSCKSLDANSFVHHLPLASTINLESAGIPRSPEALDRLYYGRRVTRSIYYLAMYPLINLMAHLATCIGQIVVYVYPNEKWSMSVRDFSNDSVGIFLLAVFISNPAFVESKFRRRVRTLL